ncbi:MAG: MFS transporter [Candidatus Omnitrophica bacterium]|nr:MFS transporter [Candidatus Omnitrophota bacterium]
MNKLFLKLSILSISLLTVMASAAISPALAKIKQAFPNVDITTVKLVLTLPSLFIIPATLLTGWLVKKIKKRVVLIIGLIIYALAGIGGGFANTIGQLLFMRAIFGIGVGLIIPLSTSLIADFFEQEERTKMMGYSGSVSHFGGVVFLMLSGWLAVMSWRYAFYVYGFALLTLLIVIFWLPEPSERIKGAQLIKSKLPWGVYTCALLGTLMMIAFYAAPTNLAMFIESERKMYTSTTPLFKDREEFAYHLERGTISKTAINSFKAHGIKLSSKAKLEVIKPKESWAIVDKNIKYIVRRESDRLVIYTEKLARPGIAGYLLSTMTMVGVIFGFVLAKLMRIFRSFLPAISIGSMGIGYGILAIVTSLHLVFLAMLFIGFSSGILMPLLLLRVAKITPQNLRAMAMAIVSIGIYLGQFVSPVVLKLVSSINFLGNDPFRVQFTFLAMGLGCATFIALVIGIRNRRDYLGEENIPLRH